MEQCSQEQLTKAIEVYRKQYGKGEIDMFKLEEIIRESK